MYVRSFISNWINMRAKIVMTSAVLNFLFIQKYANKHKKTSNNKKDQKKKQQHITTLLQKNSNKSDKNVKKNTSAAIHSMHSLITRLLFFYILCAAFAVVESLFDSNIIICKLRAIKLHIGQIAETVCAHLFTDSVASFHVLSIYDNVFQIWTQSSSQTI